MMVLSWACAFVKLSKTKAINIRKSWHEKPPTRFKPGGIKRRFTWSKCERVCIHEASLAGTVMRRVLWVQPCGLVALAPFKYPSRLAHPSGPLAFCCCSSEEMNHVLQSRFQQSEKSPPYSYRSSKDSGPSDCQLGVPKRPISSQGRGKKTGFKGERRGKKCFMKSVKIFYATGLISLQYSCLCWEFLKGKLLF